MTVGIDAKAFARLWLAALAVSVGLTAGPCRSQERKNYNYDALGRVVSSTVKSGTRVGDSANIAYDSAGNRVCFGVTLASANALCPTSVSVTQSAFSIAAASANQGSPLTFRITRSGSVLSAATVNFSTADGTAGSGVNFVAKSGTANFASGVSAVAVSIATINPRYKLPDLQMTLVLADPSPGSVIVTDRATGTIVNTNAPTIIAGSTSVSVPNCLPTSFDVSRIVTDQTGSAFSVVSVSPMTRVSSINGTTVFFAAPGFTSITYTYTARNTGGLSASGRITLAGQPAPGICAR